MNCIFFQAQSQPGTLDLTFGTGGIVKMGDGYGVIATGLVIQNDEKYSGQEELVMKIFLDFMHSYHRYHSESERTPTSCVIITTIS